MQNNVISIRISSLYGSQPTFVAFAFKTATLGPELQVSNGLSPHLWILAFKRATFGPELQVSTGPALICGFVHLQQRHYDQI